MSDNEMNDIIDSAETGSEPAPITEEAEDAQDIQDAQEENNDNNERTKPIKERFFTRDGFIMTCLYVGTLVIHVLMSLGCTIFNLTPDEFSVTAVAAYANGLDWSNIVSTGGYYGYFQSIFYIPVYWITDEPYLRYHLMLVVNGILISFAPVIVYYLSRKAFEVKKPAALLFAAVSGLYPCYMILTKYTWNETMCNLLPWVFLLLMYKAMDCEVTWKKQALSVLGGLSIVAAYATHGRMLSLLAAGAVLVILVFVTMKKRVFCLTGFYGAIVLGFIGDKFMKRFLQTALWDLGAGKTPGNTIEKMMTRLTTGEVSPERFLNTLIGHFFYFVSSTWGFGAICVAVIITAIVVGYKRRGKAPQFNEDGTLKADSGEYIDDKTLVMSIFALLVMGAIFVVSVAFKATSTLYETRMDTVMYGRYTEVFYPVAIFAAMILIYKGKLSMKQSLASLIFGCVVNVLSLLLVLPVVTNATRFVSAMIMNLAPLRYGEGMKELFTQTSFMKIIATTTLLLFAWLLIKLFRLEDKNLYLFFGVPLCCLLVYTNVYDYNNYLLPQAKNAQAGANYMTEAIELLDGDIESAAFVNIGRDRQVKAQFLYPEMETTVYSSFNKLYTQSEYPEIMLAGKEECLDLWLDGVYRIGALENNINLFTSSEETVKLAREKGLRVSEGGKVAYTAAELPATTSVVKQGHDDDADMNRENPDEDKVTALLPNGSAVYTNYFHAQRAGTILVTVYGEGVNGGKITLTSGKGDKNIAYEVESAGSDRITISFWVSKKTENIRFKLTNSGSEPITVSALTIERRDDTEITIEEPADEAEESSIPA